VAGDKINAEDCLMQNPRDRSWFIHTSKKRWKCQGKKSVATQVTVSLSALALEFFQLVGNKTVAPHASRALSISERLVWKSAPAY